MSSSPLPPDVSIGPSVLAANWTEVGVAFVIICMRMYTQIFILNHVGWDDITIILSWLAGTTNTVLITMAVKHGIGRHIMYLTPFQIKEAIKFEILAQPWGIVSPTLSRISFALFLLKFAGNRKWIKHALWSVIYVQIIANIATIVQIFAQCQHYASLWDSSVGGHCMSPHVQVLFGYVQGVVNCIHDLMLTFLPIAILKDLNMQMRVKIILIALMGLSVFGFCASIIKTIMLGSLGSHEDFTFDTVPFILWFTIENNITIITASVPSLRPLFMSITKRGTSNNNSYELSRGGRPTGYIKSGSRTDPWQPSGFSSHSRSAIRADPYKSNLDGDASSEENILGLESARHEDSAIKKTTSVTVQYTGKDDRSGSKF